MKLTDIKIGGIYVHQSAENSDYIAITKIKEIKDDIIVMEDFIVNDISNKDNWTVHINDSRPRGLEHLRKATRKEIKFYKDNIIVLALSE